MVDARERLDVMSVSLDSTLLVARERLALEPGEPLYQFNETLGRYEQLARNLDAEIKPTAEQIRRAVAEAKRASVVARDTLVAVQDLVNPKAPLYVDLTRALRAVSSAADSVRSLASYLERNPNALLRGKSTRHR
jgi:paraquat-inducible protein B